MLSCDQVPEEFEASWLKKLHFHYLEIHIYETYRDQKRELLRYELNLENGANS